VTLRARWLALLQTRGPVNMLVPLVLLLATYVAGAVGITAGAHRLWSHKSYEASPALKVGLLWGPFCGTEYRQCRFRKGYKRPAYTGLNRPVFSGLVPA
jgi:fatty-acid desaturase